jgi:two-component system sensor histidine kinase KdpD
MDTASRWVYALVLYAFLKMSVWMLSAVRTGIVLSVRTGIVSSVLVALSAVLLATIVLLTVDTFFGADERIAFMYLLPVVVMAMNYGTTIGVLTSFVSALAAAYYFFPPKFSFYIADPLHVAEMGFFLLLAGIVSKAAARA